MNGPSEDDGAILGRHFMSVLNSALALLKQADSELAENKGVPRSEFFVVDAKHGSPYVLEIAARSADARVRTGAVAAVNNAFRLIESGQADSLSAPMMAKVEKFVAPRRAKARHRLDLLELGFANGRKTARRVLIAPPLVERVDQSRAREFVCRAAVSGPAKMLDLRKKDNIQMKILRSAGGEVTCVVDWKLLDLAKAAVDNVAVVRGAGRYRPNDFHPYQIHATEPDDIEVVRPDPDAPRLSDLEGAFPGLTGGKTTGEYLREIRGEA